MSTNESNLASKFIEGCVLRNIVCFFTKYHHNYDLLSWECKIYQLQVSNDCTITLLQISIFDTTSLRVLFQFSCQENNKLKALHCVCSVSFFKKIARLPCIGNLRVRGEIDQVQIIFKDQSGWSKRQVQVYIVTKIVLFCFVTTTPDSITIFKIKVAHRPYQI